MANFLDVYVGNTRDGGEKKTKDVILNAIWTVFVQRHASTAKLLPRVFYQPRRSGSYL